jgi:hypothetical protein
MKTYIKYLLGFFLLFCIETNAQEAGTHSAIPSKTTSKGRRELRKDKRVKRHSEHFEKENGEKLESKSDVSFEKKTTNKERRKLRKDKRFKRHAEHTEKENKSNQNLTPTK